MGLNRGLRLPRSIVGLSLMLWSTTAAVSAQQPAPLTLQRAVKIALEKNPQRKAALADTRAASSSVSEARASLLPRISFSETATRGNDPVYVFGSKLRQQRFTSADLALSVLNAPAPFGNFSTRMDGSWNLFDSFASWRGVDRAWRMKEVAGHDLDRADQIVIYQVVESYYAVLLAKKQLDVAEQAMTTAQAILERSKNRYETGVAVQSDYLSSQVRLGMRKQELIRAQDDLELARTQLSTSMGLSSESMFNPTDVLAEKNLPVTSLDNLEKNAVETRPDLKSIRAREAAQQLGVSIAKSSYGPRINAFGGWEADNPTFLAGGGGNNWLAGVEIRLDLFQGGARRAQISQARALQEKVAANRETATDEVRLEVRRAFYDVDAARQQIEVARAIIADAEESLRINQNRYESGLSTIADLLAAEEAARRSQADYWETVYRYLTGYASLELASGTLNSESPVVTP